MGCFSGVMAQEDARLQKAEKLIGSGKTQEAYRILNELVKTNPGNQRAIFLTGKLFVEEHKFKLASLFLNQAIEKSESPTEEMYFTLGDAYQKSHQFEDAIETFEKCKPGGKYKKVLQGKLLECRTGLELRGKPLEVKISNLGEKINSKGHELHPLVTADFMQLFFTRGDEKEENPAKDEIYQSFNKTGWEKAIPLPGPVNSDEGSTCSGISPDGQTLYFIRPQQKGDIFFSEFRDGNWSKPKAFPYNSPKTESSLSLSADGKRLFFVSDRAGSKDIYVCNKVGNGWSKPVRPGAYINSSSDEESPWLDADGKYLYFSSKGHGTMGGYDIFKVPFGQTGADPENIGYPINSASDDLYFMLLPDEKTAFYSSGRDGGFGGQDLYSIRMSIGKTPQLALFKGTVSETSGLPIDATVLITETETGQSVAKLKAHPETGTFVTMLQSGKSYSVLVEKEGYLFFSDLVNLKDQETYNELSRDIRMQKLLPGVTLVLNNLFFDNGKSSLRKESSKELMRILSIMRQNPGLMVEIAGHLDPGGPEDILQKLSENRAQAVVDYLVATGIKSTRVIAKGYGSTKPITDNKTERSRQLNRRTEFRILSIQ